VTAGALHQVLPSVAAALGVREYANHLDLPVAPRYVVVLIDGLGWMQLAEFIEFAPFLGAHLGEPLIADFPTTTAVGLASLGTGLSPGEHGFVGASFWVPELNGLINPLHWPTDVSAQSVQPAPTLFERLADAGHPCGLVGSAQYADSGLTRAVLRGASYHAAEDDDALVSRTEHLETPCTYVYWSPLDRVGHGRGVGTPAWLSELRRVDDVIQRLRNACHDAVIIVTADHGMINAERRFGLDDHPLLSSNIKAIAGEPRARHIYLTDPDDERTLAVWRDVLGDHADVYDRASALALFGQVSDDYVDRIGDIIALPKPGCVLVSKIDARLGALPGQHGGVTDEERMIPGIVLLT